MFHIVKKNSNNLHVRLAHVRFLSVSQNLRCRENITATLSTTETSQVMLSCILVHVNAVSITDHFILREHYTDTDLIISFFKILVLLKADCVHYITRDNTLLELHHYIVL